MCGLRSDDDRAEAALKAPRARVLIADDDANIREVLRLFLVSEGYLVSTVESGQEALDAVPIFRPDVIVVDMVMPGLTGNDVLNALRRGGITVPVILISAYEWVGDVGFFRTMTKPFNLRMLAESVASAVDHGPASA
jgi:CheY-like chemotaxis protein